MKHRFQLSRIAAALAVAGGVSLFANSAMASAPLAGTNISNVATATYTDNTGTERVVTSNEVKTLVAQIGSFTLEADREAQTTANGQVTFSHILTNTGNGTDKFSINLEDIDEAGVTTFDFSDGGGKFAIYIDRNKDGIADNQIALKSSDLIELAAGESIGLVVVATTPSTALEGQLDKLKVTATAQSSTLYTEVSKFNTDTAKITTGAVLQITKAANVSATQAGKEIEYTLTFKNTGNTAATNVAIFDVLPNTVEFIAGSARFNGSTTALTDANDSTDKFEFDAEKRAFLFNIDSVAANTSGKLTFKVKVLETTNAGNIKNTAYLDPDGKKNTTGPNTPLVMDDLPKDPSKLDPNNPTTVPSNPSIVVVEGSYDGSINDSLTDTSKDTGIVTTANDIDSIAVNGKQGLPVIFGDATSEPIVVHNRGNTVDTYNLSINKSAINVLINGTSTTLAQLPVGSIVEILKADGSTPVTDTSGDGIVDTGPIPANSHAQFVVRVTLPTGEVIAENGVGLTLESTSVKNKQKDTLKLIIAGLAENKVDLVNRSIINDPTSDKGTGVGTSVPVESATTLPATPTEFDITIKNDGNIPDNYIITVPNVPTGWIVEVYEKNSAGECTTVKASNSGNIKSGEVKSFCLVVTPPAGTPAETSKDIKVEIKSPSTGTKDDITFKVVVDEQRQLTFTPDRQGQVAPGGTIVYSHTLTNTGNVLEGTADKYPVEIDWSSTLKDSNTSVYVDINNDGILTSDELITGSTAAQRNKSLADLLASTGTAGLSQNESVTIFVKVEAPATATAGESDTTIVSFKPTGSNKPADVLITDRTVINLGQVRLVKSQALSADCTTVPSTFVTTNLKAKPGTCVYYRIVATNDGNANAENVVLTDMVPSYTVLQSGSIKPAEAKEANGQISYAAGTLTPAASVTLEFSVKVDNQ